MKFAKKYGKISVALRQTNFFVLLAMALLVVSLLLVTQMKEPPVVQE